MQLSLKIHPYLQSIEKSIILVVIHQFAGSKVPRQMEKLEGYLEEK